MNDMDTNKFGHQAEWIFGLALKHQSQKTKWRSLHEHKVGDSYDRENIDFIITNGVTTLFIDVGFNPEKDYKPVPPYIYSRFTKRYEKLYIWVDPDKRCPEGWITDDQFFEALREDKLEELF